MDTGPRVSRTKVLVIALAFFCTANGQVSKGPTGAPPQTAPGELSRIDDLQKQIAAQGQQIDKFLASPREEVNKQIEAASRRELFGAIPTLLWCLLIGGTLFFLRGDIRRILQIVMARLQQGGSVKLGSIEIGAVIAIPARMQKAEESRTVRADNGTRRAEREHYYERARRVMLVHRLSPSTEEGQLYDILIYVVPALGGSIAGVAQVEYYFGGHGWQHRIFTASDRSRGFPVLTAAYGPFLCTAEAVFTDGTSVLLHRFIDFEMGNLVTFATPGRSG